MPLGVILATYGEPQVNSFAQQWMYSYRILKGLTRKIAKIPAPVLPIIATARARGRVKLWRQNAFISPLEKLHHETVIAVREELARRGHDCGETVVVPAYEFRRPTLTDALLRLDQAGCERAIVVPMYIAEGDFTHGMTRWAMDAAAAALPKWRGKVALASMTASIDDVRTLGTILASWLFDALETRGVAPGPDWAVMLAAHGTVVNPPAGVDNGLAHFRDVLSPLQAAITPRVGAVSVGWLNHTRGGEWTRPAVPDALAELRTRGFKKLVYFPWGFTTDNAETMLEGRIALRDMADPFDRVEYLECVNSYPGFVGLLTDTIENAAGLKPARRDPTRLFAPGAALGRMNGSSVRSGEARIKA
jgi:protoporphyrin/coproporphyrin ferrochelatase